jgi:hypothetical protein
MAGGNAKNRYLWSLGDHKYLFLAHKSLPAKKVENGVNMLKKP